MIQVGSPFYNTTMVARVRVEPVTTERYSSPQNPQRPRSRLWGSGVTVVSVILVVRANNYRTEPSGSAARFAFF